MKALSVHAPWWWFILHAGKDIENRDWPTNFRGTIYLHASKWWNHAEIYDDWPIELAGLINIEKLLQIKSAGGCIVGSVDIVDCVMASKSPWFCGEYGFVLRNPVAFEKPIPYKGALGFFEVNM